MKIRGAFLEYAGIRLLAEDYMPDKEKNNLSGGSRPPPLREFALKVFLTFLISGISAFIFLFIWYEKEIVLLVFAGILASIFLRTLSNGLRRLTGLPDLLSVLAVILGLIGTAYLIILFLIPHVVVQADELGRKLPDAAKHLQMEIEQSPIGKKLLGQIPSLQDLFKRAEILKEVKGFFTVTLGVFTNIYILFFISLYFSFDPGIYIKGLFRLISPNRREHATKLIGTLGITLRRWLFGRIFGMALIGLLTGIGLWFIGIPLALTLGLLAFLLTFIPYLGAVISAIPAVLLGLLDHPVKALYVIGLYVLIHTIEAYMLSPLIQQRQVLLPPALIIIAQVFLGYSAGLLGLVLATPITAVIVVVIKMIYIEDVLGEKAGMPGEK